MNAVRNLGLAVAGALIALAVAVAAPASAQDDEATKAPVRFVSDFESARTTAKTRGVPLFGYFARDEPPCPVCRGLERNVFGRRDSGRLDAVSVPVRISAGDAPAPAAAALLARYGVDRYPLLMVMNADGHVLASGVGRTIPDMLAAIAKAPAEESWLALARTEAESGSSDSLLDLLWRRMAWDEFLPIAQPRAAANPALGARVAVALARVGRAADARAAWRRLAERFPEHEDRPEWLVREVSSDLDVAVGKAERTKRLPATIAALRALAQKAAADKDSALEARAWIEVGRIQSVQLIDGAAVWAYDKAIAVAPGTRFEATALWERHTVQFRQRDYAGAKASLERLAKEFPSSPEAQLAQPEIEKCEEMLGR